MVFRGSLSDSKSPQVSRTFLSILADLNNIVVWMVSSCPLISKSSSLLINPLEILPSAPITINTTITFVFHSFFCSLATSKYLSLFSLSFNFTLWSTRAAMLIIRQVIFFCWLLGGRVFANGPGDLGLIHGRIIPKTLKMVLDAALLNTQQCKVRIKGKVEQSRERSSALRNTSVLWSNPGKGEEPSSTPRCSSYWKGSLLVTLDYGRKLYYYYCYYYTILKK